MHVLLVEDDPGDVLMTKEAFEHYKLRNVPHVVTDGEQALQFQLLRHRGAAGPVTSASLRLRKSRSAALPARAIAAW